jgi:hypothetical protein
MKRIRQCLYIHVNKNTIDFFFFKVNDNMVQLVLDRRSTIGPYDYTRTVQIRVWSGMYTQLTL